MGFVHHSNPRGVTRERNIILEQISASSGLTRNLRSKSKPAAHINYSTAGTTGTNARSRLDLALNRRSRTHMCAHEAQRQSGAGPRVSCMASVQLSRLPLQSNRRRGRRIAHRATKVKQAPLHWLTRCHGSWRLGCYPLGGAAFSTNSLLFSPGGEVPSQKRLLKTHESVHDNCCPQAL